VTGCEQKLCSEKLMASAWNLPPKSMQYKKRIEDFEREKSEKNFEVT
jgi:hypothetical protein